MPTAPSLAQALTEEFNAKRRQYVLANTRARWRIIACGISLLAAARAVGLSAISWWFILAFTACVAGINYAISRAAHERPFRTWLAHANIAIGTAMISAVAYASGSSGDVLFPAYLIAPFQAAYYLGPIEAWEALVLNVAGFGLATALPAGWGWVAFVKEVLVLVFVCVAMIPTLASLVARVRATREVLAQVERGDLTVRVTDPELDELGYLGATVNRMTDGIGRRVHDAQRQARELAEATRALIATLEGLHSDAALRNRAQDAAEVAARLAEALQRFRVNTR